MNSRSVKLFLIGALMLSIPLSIRSQSTTAGATQQQQDVVYVCPMHPEVKSKVAGSCQKCGMNLKQVSDSQASATQTRYGANYFPNFELTTQDGKKVRFYDDLLKDKLVAIDLIYTTCKYNCPIETALLSQVQKILGDQVGKDIFFYSISIDPKHDTPEILKSYAEKFKVGPGWLFLTGKEEEIDLISRKLGLWAGPDPSNADGHTPTLLIGNVAAGQWMRLSALDNTKFLARKLSQLIDNRQRPKPDALVGSTQSAPLNIDQGQYLFTQRCSTCHTIGQGEKVGPDLLGVSSRRNPVWLRRYVSVPDKVLAEKDPIAQYLFSKYKEVRMPNQGLHEVDAGVILNYIDAQTAALRAADSAGKKAAEAKQNPEK